jgi:hypothetical protein
LRQFNNRVSKIGNMKQLFLSILIFSSAAVFSQTQAPDVMWQQHYGIEQADQRVNLIAVDDADNLFVVGYLFSNASHCNLMLSKYDGQGKLLWNQIYSNTVPTKYPDYNDILLPDQQGGVTIAGTIHRTINGRSQVHLLHYTSDGMVNNDYFLGDTALGTSLISTRAVSHNQWYLLGILNGVHQLFKIDSKGNILWNAPIYSHYNYRKEQMQVDVSGQVMVASLDSILPQVTIRRYDGNTGALILSFNVAIDDKPLSKMLRMAVDRRKHIFLATKANDETGKPQLYIEEFDSLGKALSAGLFPHAEGHIQAITGLHVDNRGQVLVSGTYTDKKDQVRIGAIDKINIASGNVLWTSVDSAADVKDVFFQTDAIGNVYMETAKEPVAHALSACDAALFKCTGDQMMDEPYGRNIRNVIMYPELSISKFSGKDGKLLWNRSFENEGNIRDLRMQLNKAGDVFFACSALTGQMGKWFMGRLKNTNNNSGNLFPNNMAGINTTTETANSLSVFPNPFSGAASVCFTASQAGSGWLKVYDIEGRELYTSEVILDAGKNLFPFHEHIVAGMYVFKLETAQGSFTQQAIVY